MNNFLYYGAAAIFEIAGCYTLWMWLRLGRSPWWVVLGTLSLLLFAFFLTRVQMDFAGRAYAAYGGVYIVASLSWMAFVEVAWPNASDLLGSALCLIGAGIILLS